MAFYLRNAARLIDNEHVAVAVTFASWLFTKYELKVFSDSFYKNTRPFSSQFPSIHLN